MAALRCDCGYLAEAALVAELLVVARAHARRVHQMDLDDDHVLSALARRAGAATKE